jgi:Nucleoside-diphosphate-sugar epimerases
MDSRVPVRVFVTGGSGFIGSAVVRQLLATGHRVRCLLRPTSRTDRIDGLPVERVHGDVRSAETIAAGMDGCDATVHLASVSSWNDINSPALTEVVEEGTRHVLAAAARSPGHRVVFVSSATAVNGSETAELFDERSSFTLDDPALAYAHAKHRAENICREYFSQGVPVVIVNPGEVYGPGDTAFITAGNLVDFAKSNPVLVCAGGTSVVHVNDVAAGIVAALDKGRPGERYILAGDNLTIRELAELCLELLQRRTRIVTLPNGFIRWMTRLATHLHLPLPYNALVIPYATRYWFVDGSKARQDLGVEFRNARETLLPTITWLKNAGHVA